MHFAVSGIDVHLFIPPLISFIISIFTSMGGVSGAFLLLPFQLSFLGFTSPAVSPTNLIFNVVAIPSGVYRYIREGRMAWPLAWVTIIGTLPGVILGGFIRVEYLPNPRPFKLFVGCVLLYIGGRMLYELVSKKASAQKTKMQALEQKFSERVAQLGKEQSAQSAPGHLPDAVVRTISFSLKRVEYEFYGETFGFNTGSLMLLTFVVGMIGSTYGIGGGAISAPFFITFYALPVYTIAGGDTHGDISHLHCGCCLLHGTRPHVR
jgi:uncharacterized membrane protein YfcA